MNGFEWAINRWLCTQLVLSFCVTGVLGLSFWLLSTVINFLPLRASCNVYNNNSNI